jgi:hypothetical protein
MSDADSNSGRGYLVQVRSPLTGRVSPQWWAELYFGEYGDRRASVVAIFPLTEQEIGLSLNELAVRHPLPRSDGGDK